MAFFQTYNGDLVVIEPKCNGRIIHPHSLSLVVSILEVFEIEGLDVSASWLLRIACSELPVFLHDAINLTLPRDYTPTVSGVQRERILAALSEQGWR